MTQAQYTKKKRKYVPEDDARRFSDGVRLHPFIGYSLNDGWRDLISRYPENAVTPADFSRAAIPILERLGLIVLISPLHDVPSWLNPRDTKLVRRGNKRPIWMMAKDFPWESNLWKYVVSELRNGEIIWSKVKHPARAKVGAALN
jgi:hypothetical protein